MSLADIASNDKAYEDAIRGYEYIVNEKGSTSPFYLDAKRQALRSARNQLVEGFNYSNEDLLALEGGNMMRFGRVW
ncbi:MAG: hypothetical protein R2769_16210 [Saprospiraceae bacterium]